MIALTLLIIVGVGALFVVHNARRSVAEDMRSSLSLGLQLVDAGLARSDGEERRWLGWLEELARMDKIRHLRIQLRRPAQPVIRLSGSAPDFADERAPTWFAWAVTPALTVGEKAVLSADGTPIHVLIEANPADEIAEAWIEARSFILFMVALAAAVSVLVHITLGRAFKTLGHILRGMEDIEHGDYGKRLPRFGLPEFDRISSTFNHMAQTLATARDENRALAMQSLQAQEEERRYLAQELHDELGQSLSAIKAMAASLRNTQGDDSPAQAIMGLCDRLFGVVRGMMRRLRPLMLDELGLIPSLQDMVEHWRASHPGIDIHFICDETVEGHIEGAKIHLFRIVQEALTNVAKHAQAKNVTVELGRSEDGQIRLAVADDGLGFDPSKPRSGFGLRGMAERVASLDGRFVLDSGLGRGVALEIHIPSEDLPP
jgi:two-component system sensor histidine kinase UhpB